LKTDGTRFCWGRNVEGQLGVGDTHDRNAPRQLLGDSAWAMVSTGFDYACGATTASALYCWGLNSHNELGNGVFNPDVPTSVG
jgi:alpha-tubulin suppressor-like RCC1 family protein